MPSVSPVGTSLPSVSRIFSVEMLAGGIEIVQAKQAASGIAHIYGTGDGSDWAPGTLPVQALDHATGYGAAAAAIALMGRAEGPGWAHLSLARTAHELLVAPAPEGLPEPQLSERRNARTPYGNITFVVPPFTQMEYRKPPGEIGGAELEWLPIAEPEDDDRHH